MKWLKQLLIILISIFLVLYYPPIAIAFFAIWTTNRFQCNAYFKVLIAIAASWIFSFLLLNCLEAAILLGILPLTELINNWWKEVKLANGALGGVVVGSLASYEATND